MNFFTDIKEIKNNFFKKENIYFLLLISIIFFFDRVSKFQIINNLNESTYYINNYINLDLIWNTGIGFGFLSFTSNFIYNTVTAIIAFIIVFLFGYSLKSNKSEKLFISIIIGGALGNFYDRIIFKAVPDFIDLHYNSFHWFTFNIADIFITVGLVLMLLAGSQKNKNE
jgi:signal peptidase II